MSHWLLIIALSAISINGYSGTNVHPEDGARLTQTQVMFECDGVTGADMYEFSIHEDQKGDGPLAAKPVIRLRSTHNAILVTQGLQFGKSYKWRASAFIGKQLKYTSQFLHFDIMSSGRVSIDSFRAVITQGKEPGRDIIFLDRKAMAIDKNGFPVWFLAMDDDSLERSILRDLTLTASGTITYVDVNGAYEKDLRGRPVWQGPNDGRVSGGTKEEYHHDLNKNMDGSYVVCGSYYRSEQKQSNASMASTPRYNTVIHYNADGSIRWSWNELESLRSDTLFKRSSDGKIGAHLNGIALTKDQKRLFMSFKNISDVFLFDIEAQRFIYHLKQDPTLRFLQQHGPFLTSKDELLIYNNNINEDAADAVSHPTVMILRYDSASATCKPVWEYEVRSDRFPAGIKGKEGYASETANGDILVCAGGANYVFEVTRKKEKAWECYLYHRQKKDTAWMPFSNYRCRSASSLYPSYFTIVPMGSKGQFQRFQVFNAGSERADITLAFFDQNDKVIFSRSTGMLRPNQALFIDIPKKDLSSHQLRCRLSTKDRVGILKEYHFRNTGKSIEAL